MVSFDREIRVAWFLPNRESFKGFKEYLKIGIPQLLLSSIENSSFEVIVLLSGYLNVESVGANVIVLNICYFVYHFTLGF